MTVESSKQLNRGVFIGCFFLIITVGAIYHAGALSNLFFLKTEGVVATEAVKDMDKIIPYFINKAMPDWFAALFMLCILSASMSTLSSQFHTMGASVGSDIYGTYKPRSRGKLTNVIRLGSFIFNFSELYYLLYVAQRYYSPWNFYFYGYLRCSFPAGLFLCFILETCYPSGSDGKPLDRDYR